MLEMRLDGFVVEFGFITSRMVANGSSTIVKRLNAAQDVCSITIYLLIRVLLQFLIIRCGMEAIHPVPVFDMSPPRSYSAHDPSLNFRHLICDLLRMRSMMMLSRLQRQVEQCDVIGYDTKNGQAMWHINTFR